jgi:hypothetical protein
MLKTELTAGLFLLRGVYCSIKKRHQFFNFRQNCKGGILEDVKKMLNLEYDGDDDINGANYYNNSY